jgi:glucose/arabinose dehydrogenase
MKLIAMKDSPGAIKRPVRLHLSGFWLILTIFVLVFQQGCKKRDKLPATGEAGLKLVAGNLASPLHLEEAPDNSKRLFILDQIGKIWIVRANGTMTPDPFIDISSKLIPLNVNGDERGLLGFAFHPNYKNNGLFYVHYSTNPRPGGPEPGFNWNCLARISEFKVSATDPNKADMSSERVILEENKPQGNHNGGAIAFGPDGYLYIALGDGGGANDNGRGHVPDWYTVNTGGNGQDVYANLLGNILRIDINSGSPYGIPSDNPFVGRPGRDEIYAFGLRNPYRFSFDMEGSRDLYVGDAGQLLYEEVNIITKGGNYGWNVKEGTHCFNTDNSLLVRPSCPMVDSAGNPLIDPIIEFANVNNPAGGIATTVIGGNVYRGKDFPSAKGRYIFGIYSQTGGQASTPNGKLFISTPSKSGLWTFEDVVLKGYSGHLGMYLKGFGQSLDGEVYICTSLLQGPTGNTGKVFRLALVP